MSQIILTKSSDCEESIETTFTVDVPTQFILQTRSTVNATIRFGGALVGVLNHSNPTHNAHALGEYTIILTGTCKNANVCVAPIGDATDPLVQQLIDKLNETCEGSPINVNVCNQVDLTNIEASLASILLSVQAIDENTDGVETLLQTAIDALATLDGDDDAVALATINTSIQAAITELQGIASDTANLENLLTVLNASLIAESNETQVLLQSILDELTDAKSAATTIVRLAQGASQVIPIGVSSYAAQPDSSGQITVDGVLFFLNQPRNWSGDDTAITTATVTITATLKEAVVSYTIVS